MSQQPSCPVIQNHQQVMTRVMRRLEERPSQDRLTTSEYYEQMIESPEKATPRVSHAGWRDLQRSLAIQDFLGVA